MEYRSRLNLAGEWVCWDRVKRRRGLGDATDPTGFVGLHPIGPGSWQRLRPSLAWQLRLPSDSDQSCRLKPQCVPPAKLEKISRNNSLPRTEGAMREVATQFCPDRQEDLGTLLPVQICNKNSRVCEPSRC